MKHNSIASAVALAVAAFSGSAMALTPTTTPDITLYLAGASAEDKNIGLLVKDLCVSNTLDTYLDLANTAKPGASYTAYFCQIDSKKVSGLTVTNPKVLIYKRSAGGSAMGVSPLLGTASSTTSQPIDFMSVSSKNCSVQSTNVYGCTVNAGTTDIQQHTVDMGVSDVNPEMFTGDNTPDGFDPVNATTVKNLLVVKAAAALAFGVPVTKDLRDTLQRAEIVQGRLDAACEGDETEACMPSLNKEQISSLYAGKVTNWDSFKVNGQPLSKYASAVPANKLVHICRRVQGSGTQAVTNAFYLSNPCNATDSRIPPASKDSSHNPLAVVSNPLTGPLVIENSGSGDVEVCLNDFDNGTTNLGANHPTGKGYTAWAIGVQSLEKNATLSNNYRFVKVNGVAPTLENIANGSYQQWGESTFQYRNTAAKGPKGNALTLLNKIASDAGNTTYVSQVNASFVHPFGASGYLVVPELATPDANGIFNASKPVNPYSHYFNNKLDNCIAPTNYGKSSGANEL